MSATVQSCLPGSVCDAAAARQMGDEYVAAVSKIVASHTVNEQAARSGGEQRIESVHVSSHATSETLAGRCGVEEPLGS